MTFAFSEAFAFTFLAFIGLGSIVVAVFDDCAFVWVLQIIVLGVRVFPVIMVNRAIVLPVLLVFRDLRRVFPF